MCRKVQNVRGFLFQDAVRLHVDRAAPNILTTEWLDVPALLFIASFETVIAKNIFHPSSTPGKPLERE